MEKAKAKLNLVKDRIEKFLVNSNKTGKDKRSKEYLSTRLQLLESYWSQFQLVYEEHYSLTAADLLAPDSESGKDGSDIFSDVECAYVDAMQWLKEELNALNPILDNPITENPEHDLLHSTRQPRYQATLLKLPKITLPSFGGSYLDWPSFHDTYLTLIHNNETLAEVQKLHYLKSAITGDAAKLLRHFSITSNNYASAWKTLVDRYANTRVLVNVNLQSLVTLQPMTSESPLELRRIIDTFNQAVRALENLSRPVDQWNDWLIYFLVNKLEPTTRKDWETSLNSSTEVPPFKCLTDFLEKRLQALSAIKNTHTPERKNLAVAGQTYSKPSSRVHHSTTRDYKCSHCYGKHLLLFCPQFRSMTIDNRIDLLQRKRLCSNCLNPNHIVSSCPSTNRCKLCHQKHHTMIHRPAQAVDTTSLNTSKPITPAGIQTPSTRAHFSNYSRSTEPILLATAVLLAESQDGRKLKVRALLDQGSESNFITASLANLLNLPREHTHTSVFGVGPSETAVANAFASHDVISLHSEDRYSIQSLILPTLSCLIPSQQVTPQEWPHLLGLPLADPDYEQPAPIDLILGADIYSRILLEGVRRGPPGTPIAQLTTLGWILSGPVSGSISTPCSTLTLHATTSEVYTLLKRFWESKEPPTKTILTPDETYCEEFFKQTHTRESSGRYVVRLPMKSPAISLGSSRGAAMSCLLRLENKLARNPELHELYSTFMNEYIQLGHMEEVADEYTDTPTYYLPHHGVLKPSSSTTKLRVVFNASHKTSSHLSLNDILHIGPKLQNDLIAVLLKWRLYPYALAGDIEKMYRQIRVNKDDTDLQRILWRSSTSQPIKCYRLLTVTYGTACAPYLACKTLQQLAEEYSTTHPLAAKTIKENLYVDDALFGAYDEEEARHLRHELCTLLESGGFKLRKWQANAPTLLEGIPEEDRALPNSLKVVIDETIMTLGIEWSPSTDVFSFPITLPISSAATKRTILADISRLYDPLGWLSPVTITAKIFLQQLWLAKLDWDDPLPAELKHTWQTYKGGLQGLSEISITRWIGTTAIPIGLELHGFSDASLSAYGAAVYLRVMRDPDNIRVFLLAAKTRVSPLKTISLPRLELCGAALLTDLMSYIQSTLELNSVPVHLWTDSTIVLSWLREHPSKWKVFVANRVSSIHQNLPNARWHHVQSAHNPADCLTRGLSPSELRDHYLWWSGPQWLSKPTVDWPELQENHNHDEVHHELQKPFEITHTFSTTTDDSLVHLLNRYSNLTKLTRITAYCQRFLQNCRSKTLRNNGLLTLEDLQRALTSLIKLVQSCNFPQELRCLRKGINLPEKSKLLCLNPFLDDQGVLRVGGRLKRAPLPFDEKFPAILPKISPFTRLIIRNSHLTTLHGGVQATLHHTRNRYWILNGRSMVRQLVRGCVVCCRHKAITKQQIMGDLPADRLHPTKPFLISGVDFAGPFTTKLLKGRCNRTTKTYIAVFICFATRAIHLELVMDLTSSAFIAAFRRFISRRGRCSKLYSDNARNFVAADKELTQHLKQVTSGSSSAQQIVNTSGTEWHFIPPAAPHFGGLWEAGVKSFKHHFKRIVGSHTLSLEEMLTLVAQIEACLNSRPLHALNDDPDDLNALTPGHFLVGESLLSVPTPSTIDTPINRLSRWQLVQHMQEQLWQRWSKDYLCSLQMRYKWQQNETPVKLHDLVLIKDEHTPPAKWPLGRIVQLHQGEDGRVRVVTIRHRTGFSKRPITKLCVLPTSNDDN